MWLQRRARRAKGLPIGGMTKFWEEFQEFDKNIRQNRICHYVTWLEAFASCAIDMDDFVAVKHEMDVGHPICICRDLYPVAMC